MKIAMLAPIAWATPPAAYGPWEQVTSHLTEGLVARGHDVTLFATGTSRTAGTLVATVPAGYAERPGPDPKVMEYTHIGHVMSRAAEFDLVHNQFDFMPLTYSPLLSKPMVTTVHGFSSEQIVPVYQRYNRQVKYVSISDANRHEKLDYIGTVYNGVDTKQFTVQPEKKEDYLLYFGRIHPEKGAAEAIEIARLSGHQLLIAGLVQDEKYFEEQVKPHIDNDKVKYLGNLGPAERDRVMGNAKALLHPISFAEPFGLSVAESMMTGTPVIAYSLGSMPELIVNGESGYLVKNAQEAADLVGAIADLDRAAIAERARDRFSVERMVEGYISVYDRIV